MTEPWTIYNNTTITALLTEEQLVALQAHEGPWEFFASTLRAPFWRQVADPMWTEREVYRAVKHAQTKPSIDWSHVAPQFKWLAQDADGRTWLFEYCPEQRNAGWYTFRTPATKAGVFASYKPGTCDWKDSLVQRPEGA